MKKITKNKKRINSFSKLQTGILCFFVLVAASLIGWTIAGSPNLFTLIFNGLKDIAMKTIRFTVTDLYLDAVDHTDKISNPKYLIARNGAHKIADPNQKEGYICQFLHELSIKEKHNLDSLDKKIKDQANLNVNIRFYLIPKDLKNLEPESFMNEIGKHKIEPYCIDDYDYEDADTKKQIIYFGSNVVFSNEYFPTSSSTYSRTPPSKEYKHKWGNSTNLKALSTVFNVPSPDDIVNNFNNSNKKFDVYVPKPNDQNSPANYPKLIQKSNKNNTLDYEKTNALILINFWNENILDDNFFEDLIQNSKIKDKNDFVDNGDLTLFTQITYTLVDNDGNPHTFTSTPQGPQLQNMKFNDTSASAGGAGSARRKLNITAKKSNAQTAQITNTISNN